jgi:hypothetical protein
MFPLRPISEAQQRWIADNADRANAFASSLGGEACDDPMISFVVQTAAETIWTLAGDAAHWRAFDPDMYLAMLAKGANPGDLPQSASAILLFFVLWLSDTEQLKVAESLPILRRLEELAEPVLKPYGWVPRFRSAAGQWSVN